MHEGRKNLQSFSLNKQPNSKRKSPFSFRIFYVILGTAINTFHYTEDEEDKHSDKKKLRVFKFFFFKFCFSHACRRRKKKICKRKKLFSILPHNMGKLYVSSESGILAQ